jgi:hypothetical protein
MSTKRKVGAAHDSLQTTSGYVKIAEDVGSSFGTPMVSMSEAARVLRERRKARSTEHWVRYRDAPMRSTRIA